MPPVSRPRWTAPLGVLAGLVLGLAVVPLLARSAAVAAPAFLFAGASPATLGWRLLAWLTLGEYFPAVGPPVAAVLFAGFVRLPAQRAVMAASVIGGVLLSFNLVIPLLTHEALALLLRLPWWQHGLELSLLLAWLLAMAAARLLTARLPVRT